MNEINKILANFYSASKKNTYGLFENVDQETFTKRPVESKWSPGECIEHLNLSLENYFPVLQKRIEESSGIELKRKPYSRTLKIKLIVKTLQPPYKIKSKTFNDLQPPKVLKKESVLSQFNDYQDAMIKLIKEQSPESLESIKIASPFVPLFKLKLGEMIEFLGVHQQRHIWQAEQHLKMLR